MRTLEFITQFNMVIVALMGMAYLYQILYTIIGFLHRPSPTAQRETPKLHRFAALICARNEEAVIAELIGSLKRQRYPKKLLDIYVLADNCTDSTASVARRAGARVYERFQKALIGKGYALDELLRRIKEDCGPNTYDAYFVFDADNIVDPAFVSEMNKTYAEGYEVITCYRNSKNFGFNWISAAYSLWFLREARFLNYPRMLLGNSCAVSGTGFLVSQKVIDANRGWPFHLLTEDIQFSVHCVLSGRKIGYCDAAILYDEQPVTFRQSWNQRLRWSKGFFQVDMKYLPSLIKGIFTMRNSRFSCYDITMTVAPCVFLTVFGIAINLLIFLSYFTEPKYIMHLITLEAGRYLFYALVNLYLGLLLVFGILTVIREWKRIPATKWQKIKYLWLFPVFMATYIPITFAALKPGVTWTPIRHYSTQSLQQMDAAKR